MINSLVFSAFHVNARRRLPELQDTPRVVRPLYDDHRVVTDSQLREVLRKAHPAFQSHPTKINYIDHALRMWGVDAAFPDTTVSGRRMLQMLLNHADFASVWGERAQPLLRSDADGIAVATQEGRTTVSHVDHLLGTLAEIGVPLSHRVSTPTNVATVRDMLTRALQNFRLNQREYEWTVLALTLYAADTSPWFTCEGQEVSFDAFAERLMRQSQPQGVCYGNHRIYTLVVLLRVDEQRRTERPDDRMLSDASRAAVMKYLTEMTRRLCASQSTAGYWDGNWADLHKPIPDPDTDATSRRILATGHALEWWALAPEELQPPRETVVRAAQWLVTTLEGMDAEKVEDNYTFLTHAARSLALWRGCLPAEFEAQQLPQAAALPAYSSTAQSFLE